MSWGLGSRVLGLVIGAVKGFEFGFRAALTGIRLPTYVRPEIRT